LQLAFVWIEERLCFYHKRGKTLTNFDWVLFFPAPSSPLEAALCGGQQPKTISHDLGS